MNLTTEGKFPEAVNYFRKCIQTVPFFVALNEEQEKEGRNLVKCCAEYITAMRCQIERLKQPPAVYLAV